MFEGNKTSDMTSRSIHSSVWIFISVDLDQCRTKTMASGPITSWEVDGDPVETVSDFIFSGSKITAGGDCSHEIKRRLLLGRNVITSLDSIFRRRQWQPTPVLLPRKSHGWRSLVGCSPWGHKESDTYWETSCLLFTFMHWRRRWQPTPVFLPGESQGQRSRVGCHLWGRTELDTTEVT